MESDVNNRAHTMDALNDFNIVDSLAGRISAIQMTNFMCHSNLEVKLNPMVNFITGLNGSGKSTIMAALIVVLGGSASLTGRGTGMGDFIKRGENWAKVSITLLNDGENAFKKDLYGSSITISRQIWKTGANSYTCKSENGVIVSKKKDEVDGIISTFNWQIKNPICVLNQDVARSFLCSSDNSVRFSMFTSATQLDNLRKIYLKAMDMLASTKKQLLEKEEGLKQAEEDVAKLREKLVLFASLEKHVHGRRHLENEYLWSLVVELEKSLESVKVEEEQLEEKLDNARDNRRKLEDAEGLLEKEVEDCVAEIEAARNSAPDKREEKFALENKIHDLDKELEKSEVQLRQVLKKIEKEKADMVGVREHIERCDDNSMKNEEENKRLRDMIRSLKEKLSEVKQKLDVTQQDFDLNQRAKMESTKTMERLKLELREMEQTKKRLEVTLNSSQSKGDDNLMKFGPFTANLLKAIDEAARRNSFQKKPVGPCGMYITLSGDPKWARAVESVIGGLMCTYCCDNQKDFQVLSRLMDRVCGERQPPIIISKFQAVRHNVESKKAVVRDHPSIFDVLSFTNDVVHNTFIDQLRIETIVLFETDKQAASIMTHIQNVPKNLKMGLTLASDQYYPAPNYRTYYGNTGKPLRYFSNVAKSANALKRLEGEMAATRRSMDLKNAEMVAAREEYMKVCDSLTRAEEKLKQTKQNERKIQVELNHLQDKVDSIPVTITKVALEEELSILQKTHEESTRKAEACRGVLKSVGQKRAEYLERLNKLLTFDNEREQRLREMEETLQQKKRKRTRAVTQKEKAGEQLKALETKLEEVRGKMAKGQEELDKRMRQAEEICPERMDTDKTPVEVQKLLAKCERYLKTAQKLTGSKEEVVEAYKTKREVYKKRKKVVDVLKGTMESLVQAISRKLNRLKILQTHTANLVSFYFQATLKTRGYDGHLIVNFDQKTLDLEVTPANGTVARKDTKTLSGGERSYSTVSFILAIWKVVDMPVYFLDEFDVFMDRVNRKVIMNLLLEHTTAQTTKQFIFITPHDVSGVNASDAISVYRLPDPKRKA